jgi:hypothetical protein
MGTDTPNPPVMSPAEAADALDAARLSIEGLARLLEALVSAANTIDPAGMIPLADAATAAFKKLDPAVTVAYPLLRAAEAGRRTA